MLKCLIRHLHFDNIGGLELIVALYPILMGYGYGGVIRLDIIVLLILDAILIPRNTSSPYHFLLLKIFILFVFFHELFLLFVISEIPSYYYNNLISYMIFLGSIIIISPNIDIEKFKGAVNLVSLICIIGLLYHVIILPRVGEVTPLKLPFLPTPESDSRLFQALDRPRSFFWEPQSFVSYMLITLTIALNERKLIWAGVIVIANLLSTSTTGIVLSFLMLLLYVFTSKVNYKIKMAIIVIGVIVLFIMLNSSFFERGIDKFTKTDFSMSGDIRMVNGPLLFTNLSTSNLLWGIPYVNIHDFVNSSVNHVDNLIYLNNGSLFIASFWLVLSKFGIIGISLYLAMYIIAFIKIPQLRIYLIPLTLALFTNPDYINSSFTYEFIVIYSVLIYNIKQLKQLPSNRKEVL